jgi:predicted RNase H-like HicB family nuclease
VPLLTIVEHYVVAAWKRGVLEPQEDGTFAAYVPECPGVIAFGADVHECARDLFDRLLDWVKVSLANGNALPIIDGIDMNSDAGKILASYHHVGGSTASGEDFYEDEDELYAAFAQHGEVA